MKSFKIGYFGRKMFALCAIMLAMPATLTLGLPAVSVAQGEQTARVAFQVDGLIGTEMVKRGTYTLVIPEGSSGTLTVKAGRRSITVPFKRQETNEPAATDKITYRENGDGTRSVSTIAPRGKRFVITI